MNICNTKKPKLVKTINCLSFFIFCKNNAKNKFEEESFKSAKTIARKSKSNAIIIYFYCKIYIRAII